MAKKPGMRFTTEREWGLGTGTCILCDEKARVFWFEDNELYGSETLCLECLRDAIELLKEDSP